MAAETLDPGASGAGTVLVTGATGYVGGHLVARLLGEGHRTRVTVREPGREAEVLALVRRAGVDREDLLEFAVADLSADAGWAAAADGVSQVLHVASPFPATPPENEDELVRPARDGALRVLSAARTAGVRRVVMTSSFAAVGYTVKPDARYTEEDWTDPGTEGLPAYPKSKVLAERAAWDFVETNGGIELAVVNPVGIFGPVLGPRLAASVEIVRSMLSGGMPVVPLIYFGVVDVRDVVDLHLRAMHHPKAAGERFLAVGGPSISFLGLARTLRAHLPAAADALPSSELTLEEMREAARTEPALRDAVGLGGRIPVISNAKARAVLDWRPRDVTRTLLDTADSLIELGLVPPGGTP
ncbi:NAD-dependent epimerase/dehydratase family protein [Streptomyces sp. NPDC059466]|uniref:NAD-dependent epimerase/dehydratase family protein n=1 Tax=unclassified Streptomyces TaxID=2593676 RepID=UPI00367F3912